MSSHPHLRRRDWANLALRLDSVRGVQPLVFHRENCDFGGFEPAFQMPGGAVYFEMIPYCLSLRSAGAWARGRAAQAAGISYLDDSPLLAMLEKRAPR